ncbi:hypothetical protein DYBT9275_02427 [Dyadobacter sp. CECT 9275]|uniref:HpcH/HpaI aldolase/citrate lyase domain-containing protein n=1 Tax=Dyadobacter helix TaxID=2822344 RepID=A0A916JAT2_9BACT|nr:aldolase/citrate lyase family protein [Dyadobacter sp. CECT 9275]CAG5000261.1 hypothetical protein DYBT9275_02427 [Dyadobacter sp. CECT 9275]
MIPNLPQTNDFQLFLFTTSPSVVQSAIEAGVDGIIVDWENQGKKKRQENFDTEINYNTYEDLCRVREVTPQGKLICRINGFSDHTESEIEMALQAGADEIFLPMVHTYEEARQVSEIIGQRAGFSILIETASALECIGELSQLPLRRVYVGLNDLHIQQNSKNIFVPLLNDTLVNIRRQVRIPLGAGGVTYPPSGLPIASKYLINEYARLGINFSFLRRSFIRDYAHHSMEHMVFHIRKAYQAARMRSSQEIELDFQLFRKQVESWVPNPSYV